MDTLQLLNTRRSTKAYTNQQVPDQILDQILQAGLNAPSGRNNQKVVTVAIRNTADRNRISKLNAAVLGMDTDPFYGAPCVVAVLSDPERNTWVEDGSLVLGNLLHAAHALGLGSCWVHRAREVFDSNEGKALLVKWGLPTHLRGIGFCLLGYPAKAPIEKTLENNRIFKID